MIINKTTKGYQTQSHRPAENWLDIDAEGNLLPQEQRQYHMIPDGTALAEKIIAHYPYFDFVLDEAGNLIDITPTERPPGPEPEPDRLDVLEERVDEHADILGIILGEEGKRVAPEVSRAFQFLAQSLDLDDSQKMEIASLYPKWAANIEYAVGAVVKHGVNADNETQLYRVIQDHKSQEDWPPDIATSLYAKIGFDSGGVPIWTQPGGAHDAYMLGDEVSHKGDIWISDLDNNIWEPGVYGWRKK